MNALLLGFLVLSQVVLAKNVENKAAMEYLQRRGEVYFKFEISKKEELAFITRTISIAKVSGYTIYAYANRIEFERFLLLGYDYVVLQPHGESIAVPTANKSSIENYAFVTYPTYDMYVSLMNSFASNYPDLCQIINIGTSVNGRAILFARLTSGISVGHDRPKVLFSSTMHGDETAGYVILLRLINHILSGYASDTRLTNMLDAAEIWINPLANPDGTYFGGNGTVWAATRYNANNVDLNRNFPDPVAGDHPDGFSWQPETQAFMNFASLHKFVLGANFHGGEEVVSYPWDDRAAPHADANWWVYISRKYADEVHKNSPIYSGYMRAFNNGITNGYAWYGVYGGRQDYMNFYHHCRELTIELSLDWIVPELLLETLWNYNRSSLLGFIENVYFGLRGKIYDGETSAPMVAEVFIPSHDNSQSQVYSGAPYGSYYRPLYQGVYGINVNASGFYTGTFDAEIHNESILTKNIALPRVCVVDKYITSNLNVNNGYYAYKTTQNIFALSEVGNSASVNLCAGQTIILAPGFQVGTGCSFSASIAPTPFGKQISSEYKKIDKFDSANLQRDSIYGIKGNVEISVSPNPFNPSTTISFIAKNIAGNTCARISIYSLAGAIVRSYEVSLKEQSGYTVVWDAKDNVGEKVTNGIYIVNLSVGSFSRSVKAIYVK